MIISDTTHETVALDDRVAKSLPQSFVLSFNLERVIFSQPSNYADSNPSKEARRRNHYPATHILARYDPACPRVANVHIHPICPDLLGPRSALPSRHHNISR